ncbi:CHAT domain-containing protein [Dactylosporangium sp. NPDC005555]|uniref:CHAT domain-containing protein n=1 Tax=Dactylosporangium sp. NPDC005555 TaxID=3154889 RepID=UPI0033B59CD3
MRTTWLAGRISRRVKAFTDRGDARPVLDPEALAEADRLARAAGPRSQVAAYVLGWLHWCRFQALPAGYDAADLAAAVRWFAELPASDADRLPPNWAAAAGAAGAVPADPGHGHALGGQAEALLLAYQEGAAEAPDTLDRAAGAARAAEAAGAARDPLAVLFARLSSAYQRRGAGRGDADTAVDLAEAAARIVPPDADVAVRTAMLETLSSAYRGRFEVAGDRADIDRAVDVARRAVAGADADDAELTVTLSALGNALVTRHRAGGPRSDLDDAVAVLRQAVAAAGEAGQGAGVASNLGAALRERYARDRAVADLTDAVLAHEAAAGAAPPGDPDRGGYLTNLGAAYTARYQHARDPADLDAAIDAHREALAEPGEADRAGLLMNLAHALHVRHEEAPRDGDAAESVRLHRQATGLVPSGHARYAEHQAQLAMALTAAGRLHGGDGDLDDAVAWARTALAAAPEPRPHLLVILGNALRARFEVRGGPADRTGAVDVFRRAATDAGAPAALRILAARRWGALAAGERPADGLDGFATAVGVLSRLAWQGLPEGDRQHLLGTVSGLAGDAAAAAIDAGDPRRAVALLEQGRAVLWAQRLDGRADLSDLAAAAPDLAAELATVRAALDLAAPPGERRRDLAAAYDRLLARIRALPPSAALPRPDLFQRPVPVADLLAAVSAGDTANAGTVAIVNVSQWRCDALLVRDGDVTALPLPGLTLRDAVTHAAARLGVEPVRSRDLDAPAVPVVDGAPTTTETLRWLWAEVTGPVLDALGLAGPPDGDWPRLWWCPTGPLTLLPLHAAGAALDRVVSSYTPTLHALGRARTGADRSAPGPMLVVTQPATPGQAPLPAVRREQDQILDLFGAARCTLLTDAAASRARVGAALARHPWAHLCGHGTQNLDDPSRGGLVLADGVLTVDELRAGSGAGEWVFLGACQTATGGLRTADEVISVASAMHHGGWRHVVGALWPVEDTAAADVAAAVYPPLVRDGRLRPEGGALALHHAVRALRDRQPHRPAAWAPFVHLGP